MNGSDRPLECSLVLDTGVPVLRVRGHVDGASADALRRELLDFAEFGDGTTSIDLRQVTYPDRDAFRSLIAALRSPNGKRSESPVLLGRSVLEGLLVDPAPAADAGVAEGQRVRSELRRVGSMSMGHRFAETALGLVTTIAAATVDGADGVSVSLQRQGRLMTIAASNETVSRMDRHQYDTGEGPCIAASEGGRVIHVASLAREHRWANFSPRAADEGIASILSTPLVALDKPVGALNMYSNRDDAFGTRQHELAALFSEQASGILDALHRSGTTEDLDRRILDALRAREVIARAQGVLMERERLSAERAADALQRAARASQTTVVTEAEAMVASTTGAPPTAGRSGT